MPFALCSKALRGRAGPFFCGPAHFFAGGGMPLPRSRDWRDLMETKPQAKTEPHFPVDMFLEPPPTRSGSATTTTTPQMPTTPVTIPDDVTILPDHAMYDRGQKMVQQPEVELLKVNVSMTPTQLLKTARLTGRDRESTDFFEPIIESFKKQGQFELFLQNALAFRRRNNRKYWGPYNPVYWGKYAAEGKEWFINARKALARAQTVEKTNPVPEGEKTIWRLPSYRGVWLEVTEKNETQPELDGVEIASHISWRAAALIADRQMEHKGLKGEFCNLYCHRGHCDFLGHRAYVETGQSARQWQCPLVTYLHQCLSYCGGTSGKRFALIRPGKQPQETTPTPGEEPWNAAPEQVQSELLEDPSRLAKDGFPTGTWWPTSQVDVSKEHYWRDLDWWTKYSWDQFGKLPRDS